MDKKILNIKYFSQHEGISDENWKMKGCATACLKMVLDYLGKSDLTMNDLLEEGKLIGGFQEGLWDHESVVRILRNHGINAYRQEFRSVKVDLREKKFEENNFLVGSGIEKIVNELKNEMPVLVSVKAGFGDNQGPHMILINGCEFGYNNEVDSLIYHDPDNRNGGEKKYQKVDIKRFKEYWRRFAIFVEK